MRFVLNALQYVTQYHVKSESPSKLKQALGMKHTPTATLHIIQAT